MTIDAAGLSVALRLSDDVTEQAQAARLLDYGTAAVAKAAPLAPDAIQNEAVVQVCRFLFDVPNAPNPAGEVDVIRACGAWSMLAPWRAAGAVVV